MTSQQESRGRGMPGGWVENGRGADQMWPKLSCAVDYTPPLDGPLWALCQTPATDALNAPVGGTSDGSGAGALVPRPPRGTPGDTMPGPGSMRRRV